MGMEAKRSDPGKDHKVVLVRIKVGDSVSEELPVGVVFGDQLTSNHPDLTQFLIGAIHALVIQDEGSEEAGLAYLNRKAQEAHDADAAEAERVVAPEDLH